MKNTYQIQRDWKHVQGHIVTSKYTPTIQAESEEEAIQNFIDLDLPVGKNIRWDKERNYYYMHPKNICALKDENIVYAVKL